MSEIHGEDPSRNRHEIHAGMKFFTFQRESLRKEFKHHEDELKMQYQTRRLLRRSINIGGSILMLQFCFLLAKWALDVEYFSSPASQVFVIRLLLGIAFLFQLVYVTACMKPPAFIHGYYYFDVWVLFSGSVIQLAKWSIRDVVIAGLAVTKGFMPGLLPASFQGLGKFLNLFELTIWGVGLMLFVVSLEVAARYHHERVGGYARIVDGHGHQTPSTKEACKDALCEVPGSFALALGFVWTKIIVETFFIWKHFYEAGPFLTFFAQAFFAKFTTGTIVILVKHWNSTKYDGIFANALVSTSIKTCTFVFAWSVADCVLFFYEGIIMECSMANPCSYKAKLLYAIIISVGATQGMVFLKALRDQEKPVGTPVDMCEIDFVENGIVHWKTFDKVKAGHHLTFIELLNNTMSLMIGFTWSAFFMSLVGPMYEANDFGHGNKEFGMAVSTGIMCVVYWSLGVPAFHEVRNAVRTLAQRQIEALARIMHDTQINDEDLRSEEGHGLLLPDLVDRLNNLVQPPKPVFGPEFVGSVKKDLLAHYKDRLSGTELRKSIKSIGPEAALRTY